MDSEEILIKKLEKCKKFLENIINNYEYDCDEDAHKYNTDCRCCEAQKLLDKLNNQR